VPFSATQRVVIRRPGFVWDARIRSGPGIWIHVRDALVQGEGVLQAALFGAIPVADLRGSSELTQGELMRFLAEAAWYPTALLPGQGQFRAYGVRAGMRVPIEAEVAWIVDGELRPYWRGRIESIDYEFPG
jgi:hypothetical protein